MVSVNRASGWPSAALSAHQPWCFSTTFCLVPSFSFPLPCLPSARGVSSGPHPPDLSLTWRVRPLGGNYISFLILGPPVCALAVLYLTEPNGKSLWVRASRVCVSIVSWLAFSEGYALYVERFALSTRCLWLRGTVIVLLIWLTSARSLYHGRRIQSSFSLPVLPPRIESSCSALPGKFLRAFYNGNGGFSVSTLRFRVLIIQLCSYIVYIPFIIRGTVIIIREKQPRILSNKTARMRLLVLGRNENSGRGAAGGQL
jgi:hypothetical protein